MKKVIFTLAIVSMFGFVACSEATVNQDSIDSVAMADSIAKVEAEKAAAEAAALADSTVAAVENAAEEVAAVATEEVAK